MGRAAHGIPARSASRQPASNADFSSRRGWGTGAAIVGPSRAAGLLTFLVAIGGMERAANRGARNRKNRRGATLSHAPPVVFRRFRCPYGLRFAEASPPAEWR